MKKEYLQPLLEIEYFDDVILCDNASAQMSNYGNDSDIELP